jgi:hypothetical protein
MDFQKIFGALGGKKVSILSAFGITEATYHQFPWYVWVAVGMFLLGQGIADGLSQGKTSSASK